MAELLYYALYHVDLIRIYYNKILLWRCLSVLLCGLCPLENGV